MKPFISVVIPTYNRANDLARALDRLLAQNDADFEIIVVDNASEDGTARVVAQRADPRIRYYRNDATLLWYDNMRNAVTHARGTYVFLHGDDDCLLYDDVLRRLEMLLRRIPYGFVRMAYINYHVDQDRIFDVDPTKRNDAVCPTSACGADILRFIEGSGHYFMTGIVIRSELFVRFPIRASHYAPWYEAAHEGIRKHGGLYWSRRDIAASWSVNASHARFFLESGKLTVEPYLEAVSAYLGKTDFTAYRRKILSITMRELPACKYYAGTAVMRQNAARICEVEPALSGEVRWWSALCATVPDPILRLVRNLLIVLHSYRTVLHNRIPDGVAKTVYRVMLPVQTHA